MPALRCGQCGRATPETSAVFGEDGEPLCNECSASVRESTVREHHLRPGHDSPRVCSCGGDMQLVKLRTILVNFVLPVHSYRFQCSSCGKQFTGNSLALAVFELAVAAPLVAAGLLGTTMGAFFQWLLVLAGGGWALHTLYCLFAWLRFPKRAPVRTSG